MTGRSRMLLVGLVAAQAFVIFGMTVGGESTLREETDVVLQTVPVDPRDLFRGDYVVLRYEISTIVTGQRPDMRPGATVYVELVEGPGSEWLGRGVATEPLAGVARFLRGTVVAARGNHIDIEYGIEQYFVPEERGHAVERARDVDVVVAVDDSGHGVIRHLIVDGEVWDPYG